MTIEVVKDKSKWFGLRHERKARVLEYRFWEEQASPGLTYSGSADVEMTHMTSIFAHERRPGDYFQFLHPLSERSLMVITKTDMLDEGEKVIYSGDEINQANLKTLRGETVVYRATKPGDYPPLEPGQIDTTERAHKQNGVVI